MFATRTVGDLDLLIAESLHSFGVPHGFTTRSKDVGLRAHGERDHERLARAVGLSGLASMRQVHGCAVRLAQDAGVAADCDGVLTARPDVGCVVHTADCVPLLLWASDVNVVSAVHAGWRGTLQEVASAAVSRLIRDQSAAAEALHVAIGPAIRECCFEVGDEVVDAFVSAGRDRDAISKPGPRAKRHVDLIGDNLRQLEALGVRREHVYDCGRCTSCDNDLFYSYRREGAGVGRVMGVIGVARTVD